MNEIRVSPLSLAFLTAVTGLLAGCGDDEPGSDFERSCGGEPVLACRPYEYARVTEASVMPAELQVDDPTATAEIRIAYEACSEAPFPPQVVLQALIEGSGLPDAGRSEMLAPLETYRDDGMNGDAEAGDGRIDVMVQNPFFDVPPNSDITLRFQPRINSCNGEVLEIPYETGPLYDPDA